MLKMSAKDLNGFLNKNENNSNIFVDSNHNLSNKFNLLLEKTKEIKEKNMAIPLKYMKL